MARREKRIYMPMGTGGLIRYAEEEEKLIRIKPKHLIYLVIGIVILEILLRIVFP